MRYVDPDGRETFFNQLWQEYSDYATSTDKEVLYTLNTIDRASNGDLSAQTNLKYAFHQAGRDVLNEISDKLGYGSLAFLAVGCPEGAVVSGCISMVSDGILAIDDLVNGNIKEGLTESAVLVASFAVGKGTEKVVSKVAGISINVGKSGRYYEVGKRGAIKTETALKKLIAKDISKGYFGKNIAPELTSQIVEKAVEGLKKVINDEN